MKLGRNKKWMRLKKIKSRKQKMKSKQQNIDFK